MFSTRLTNLLWLNSLPGAAVLYERPVVGEDWDASMAGSSFGRARLLASVVLEKLECGF